ncbi:M13 family metallopeptidase [Mycoplasma struthionis]|uniref:M13 family peptidase n=1 Tax=Mycoplasma struthionis TaxID=538220 RepID=A0A3G8LFV1_9MOLU|nr:M13 family metallopeptidase [Mycoplasma struthionis]AZG68519.1 M13 family peptidase [Mycoplasma struthionis]
MDKKLLKQDFFAAVNGKWIEKHKIPDNKNAIGSFEHIDETLTKLKSQLLNKWLTDTSDIENNKEMLEMVKFYKLVQDWETRKEAGLKPLSRILNWLESFKSWDDINKNYLELLYSDLQVPIIFSTEADFKNSDTYALFISDPKCILPEKNYYSDKDKKDKLFAIWSSMVSKLLKKLGKSAAEAKSLISKALKWDVSASKLLLSAEEYAVMTNIYNPVPFTEAIKEVTKFNLEKIIKEMINNKKIDEVVLVSKDLLKAYEELIIDENFENYKAMLYISTILTYAKVLDYKTIVTSEEFWKSITGVKKTKPKNKLAVRMTTDGVYKMVFGKYYGLTYFGPQNKVKVESMIKKMINIYQIRLEKNDWLGEETRKKAILKLSKMGVQIGYPEKINSYYSDLIVKEYDKENALFENYLEFNKIINKWYLDRFATKIDKELWSMSPAIVNAYFSPTQNKIVFPAGILQAPFYSEKQTSSQNYGGIGAVIAHEISHGFDNNGANFDENGNMINWWTEEDKKQFEKRAQGMIELFDSEHVDAGKCNGKLTVSENIADAGGLSCALEAAKTEEDFSARKFYINFATIWRTKYRIETEKLLLETDVHAPAKLRTNVQIKNSDDFYKTFKVSKKDKMYLDPSKRVKIW